MLMNENEYLKTVEQVKQEIRTAQYRATIQVNCELLQLYHAIGTVINAQGLGQQVRRKPCRRHQAVLSGDEGIFRPESQIYGKVCGAIFLR